MADSELKFILRMRDEATAILKAHGMAVGDASGKHKDAANNAKAHGDALGELGRKAREATEAVAALWGSNELAKKSLEAFNEYEQGMIRIARTTQIAGQAMADFQQSFDAMARSTKGASVENLLEYSAIAGQLGIRGSADVLHFSETLGKLGTVTNVTGEAGAKQFGRLLLLTGEGAGGVTKLANSLAGLQADTKASAAEILMMGSQLAQTTAGFKLGTAEITGMAAAASQLNIQPYLLSNAVGRSLRAMKDGALNATVGMRDLSTMLGTNRKDFLQLIDTHPEVAMLKFLNVIKALQANGQSVTGFLQKFQLQGDESQKVLLTLAKNVEEVNAKIKESQNLQNGGGPGALEEQYKGFLASLQAQIAGLSTAWDLFAKDLGKALAPAVKEMLQGFTGLLNATDDLFNAIPDVGQKIVAWAAVGVPALFGLNQLLRVFGTSLFGVGGKVLGLAGNFTVLSAEARAAAAGVAAVEAELTAVKGMGGAAGAAGAAGGGMLSKLGKGVGILGLAYGAHELGKGVADELNSLMPEVTDAIGQWRHNVWKRVSGVGHTSMNTAELMGLHDRKANSGQGDAQAGADKPSDLGSVTTGFQATDVNKAALERFDEYTKRLDGLTKAKQALEALKEGSKQTPGRGDAKTDVEIAAIERSIVMAERALDPMNKLRDAWAESLAGARAYTKEQQNQFEIAKAVAEQARSNPRFTTDDRSELTARMQEIQDATRTKAFREQAITLSQQLQIAATLTQADKDRLEIDQQIAALSKDKGFNGDQLAQLAGLLTLIKQTTEATAQFKSLNPQSDALIKYNDQLALLNMRLQQGKVSQAEYNREKTKLDSDTLAARDPIGAIVQSQKEELQQLGVTGKYREADLKTLQQITDLKKQGVIADDASGRAVAAQLGSNNRMVQDIKDVQAELNSLTESFGSGLSTAIGQAINGQKYAFQKMFAGMGQKMMDVAFTNIAKSMEPSINGLLGGMFGQAKGGMDALGKLGGDQAASTMATASMTVTAASVTINSAQGAIDALTKEAGLTGSTAPGTVLSSVPSVASAAVPEAAKAATNAIPALTGTIGASNVPQTIPQPWVGTSITKALGDPVKELAKAGEAMKAMPKVDALPPLAPYNPGQFPTKGFGEMSMPAPGLGTAFGKLGDALGMTKKQGLQLPAQAAPSPFGDLSAAKSAFGPNLDAGGRPTADALTQHMMTKYGLTREQATGATGTMGYESGDFKTLQERGQSGTGSGLGYAQWTGPRRTEFENYAKQHGLDTHSYKANEGMLDHDLEGRYSGTITAMKATDNPRDASRAFLQHEEGMNVTGRGRIEGVPAVTQHADRAQQYYDQGVGANPASNLGDVAKKAQEQMTASQKALADSLKQTSQQTTGSLTGLSSGITSVGKTAAEGVPDMSSFGSSISGMLSKLSQGGGGGGGGGLGGLFGGGGGGGFGGDFGGAADFAAFHSGGLVGVTNTGLTRSVNPAIFSGASRFHDGLGDDEFPAILQKGERVLTRNQDSRASQLMARMSDTMSSTRAGESMAPARPNNSRVVMNIQTRDASSFRYSQGQIMAQAHAGMSRAASKNG